MNRADLTLVFVLFFLASSAATGGIIEVRKPGDPVLADAIRQSGRGDTILVYYGIYSEGNIRINKPLVLRGIGRPVLDGGGESELVIITADSVTVEGFIIQNVGFSYTQDRAGVRIEGVAYCRILDNEVNMTFFGIYLKKAKFCTIGGNKLQSIKKSEANSGNGIHLWDCQNITIRDNSISGHRDGIYLEFTDNSLIERNTSADNLRYGLHFMFSNHDQYFNNTFRSNGTGVAVMFSNHIIMKKNNFIENWGQAAYGLLFKDITDSEVTGNRFYRNTTGLVADGAMRVTVQHNDFIQNGWAVNIYGNSMNNILTANNFINNTFDIATNTDNSTNTYINNYWDQYTGYDLDRNGFGDVPYRPVKLFSYVVAKVSASIILLRSFFTDVINFAEKVSPSLTPANLMDPEPNMKMINYDNSKGT